MNNEIFSKSNSWAFIEARRVLEHIGGKVPEKGFVLFETGYGPSGLPHIGTFGEVVRTSFVRFAFSQIAPEIPTKMLCVSDDYDGMRKIPDNVPNPESLKPYIGMALTEIPDPFDEEASYGHFMNKKLRSFLDNFGFDYEFISASEEYKSGTFNQTMLKVIEKYDEIMGVMLPSLREERQRTYSPFMPKSPKTGRILAEGVVGVDKKAGLVIFKDEDGTEHAISPTDGNCKLQWKVDFGARWYSLGVDYEIFGKDHQTNAVIYSKICRILGGKPPVNFAYEMFLDENGEKISKSSGNGISVEKWLKYAPRESMAYFMYVKPKTAKRLYFDVIPKSMDEYISYLNGYQRQNDEERVENPAYYIHFGKVPQISSDIGVNFSLLLNLVSACNSDDKAVIWGFIKKYDAKLNEKTFPILDEMIDCALNYYHDFVAHTKKFYRPNDAERKAILEIKSAISTEMTGDEIQSQIFAIGKKYGYEDLKEWFRLLYRVFFGQEQGPRMGGFIKLYGVRNFVRMIEKL